MKTRFIKRLILLAVVAASPATLLAEAVSSIKYDKASSGTSLLSAKSSETVIKILVEAANLGSNEVEIGEITLPAGLESSGHSHGSIEFFYVLSGRMEHIVNGESSLLTPGMIGIVRPGDTVVHKIPGAEPCKALVIWAPGGEIERLKKFFDVSSIE